MDVAILMYLVLCFRCFRLTSFAALDGQDPSSIIPPLTPCPNESFQRN